MHTRNMMSRSTSVRRTALAGTGLVLAVGSTLWFGISGATANQQHSRQQQQEQDTRLTEIWDGARHIDTQSPLVDPNAERFASPDDDDARGTTTGGCPIEVVTHSSANFEGGQFVVQAGFAEGEIAASQFFIDPDEFPIKLELAEIIFATSNTSVTTTTEWSILIWEGNPETGNLVGIYSSDDVILPHIVLGPGTNGVNVQFLVDPDDPDQIFISDNGSSSFTIGYRIDAHNAPSSNPCLIPPSQFANAFPTTDTAHPDSPDAPTLNWIYALPECPVINGWLQFSDFPSLLPGGDWNIRFSYTPISCELEIGACCLPDGSCEVLDEFECQTADGLFMGDATTCGDITCPDPVGACCIDPGQGQVPYCEQLTEAECDVEGGYWHGGGVDCAGSGDDCPPIASGACCFESSCADLTEEQCNLAGGSYGGDFTECNSFECNPEGACCLPNGDCVDGIIEADCIGQGGAFQGTGTSCDGVNCPDPVGACCLESGDCIGPLSEANCLNIPGASWGGFGTTCEDVSCTPIGACCLDGNVCFEDLTEENCLAIPGASWAGADTSCDDCGPACPTDLTGDELVDVNDLLALLAGWGTANGDVNGDNNTDVNDLLALLAAWGPC